MTRHGDLPPQGEKAEMERRRAIKQQKLAVPVRPEDCTCPYDVVGGRIIPCEACSRRGRPPLPLAAERPETCKCPRSERDPMRDIESDLPCWPCFREGFEVPAPRAGGDENAE